MESVKTFIRLNLTQALSTMGLGLKGAFVECPSSAQERSVRSCTRNYNLIFFSTGYGGRPSRSVSQRSDWEDLDSTRESRADV